MDGKKEINKQSRSRTLSSCVKDVQKANFITNLHLLSVGILNCRVCETIS